MGTLSTIGGATRWRRWFLQRVKGDYYRLLIERWSVTTGQWMSVTDKEIEAPSWAAARAMALQRFKQDDVDRVAGAARKEMQ